MLRCYNLGRSQQRRYSSSISQHLKRRHGQNLSNRYAQLERTLSGKQSLSDTIDDNLGAAVQTHSPAVTIAVKATVPTFHGLRIPMTPKPPQDDGMCIAKHTRFWLIRSYVECCMSGCAICVYDLYEEALDTYKSSLAQVQSSLRAMAVPESDWPTTLQPSSTSTTVQSRSVTLSAFEQLEATLKAKQETASHPS